MLADLKGRPLDLRPWPAGPATGTNRAWDAADAFLLSASAEIEADSVLAVNDRWGALALGSAPRRCAVWSDSHLCRLALAGNAERHGPAVGAVEFIPSTAEPPADRELVLMRIPKALDLFRAQLSVLRRRLPDGTTVLLGGMARHTPARVWSLAERHLGPVTRLPGRGKACGAVAVVAPGHPPDAQPTATVRVPRTDLVLEGGPGVFSAGKLDGGTRLLLAHLPVRADTADIVDLGCGNGVLALAAALACPASRIRGVDESYLAVASAEENLVRNAGRLDDPQRVAFTVADGLADVRAGSVDLVLCNPPFHADHTVDGGLAARLLEQAHRALRPGGELRLVANRHLGHHARLNELFGGCRRLATDERFDVLSSQKGPDI